LSEQAVDALAYIISGGSANDGEPLIGLYRQAWKLEAWFVEFGIKYEEGKSRFPATVDAIRLASFLDDDLLKRVIEKAADPRDFIGQPEKHHAVVEYLNARLAYDGLKLIRSGRVVKLVELTSALSSSHSLAITAASFDFDSVQLELDRALNAAKSDPEIAVTAACSLIESVCRSILDELDQPLPAKEDISGLYRAIREPLGLSPTKEGLSAEIVNDVKSALSGLVTAVQSIGALRTHAGSAHGKSKGVRRIDTRIANLAIHSASAVALFLIETWQLRFPGRKLPAHRP
jgi:hypothetical protein